MASAIAAYLGSPQNAFVTSERATKPLCTGTIPSEATCLSILKHLGPQNAGSQEATTTAIRGIQNTAMQFAANQDLQNKL